MNFSVKTKILVILLVGCISIVVVGALGLIGMKSSNNGIESLYRENLTNVLKISRIMELMRDNRIQLLLAQQHNPDNPALVKQHEHPTSFHTDIVKKNIEEISMLWSDYLAGTLSAAEKKLAEDFAAKRAVFVREGLLTVMEAQLADDFNQAANLIATRSNPAFKPADEAAKAIYANESAEAKKEYEDAASHYRTTLILIIAASAVAVLISILLALMIIRSIATAADSLIKASDAMANGDLSQRVRLASRDELGVIGASFDTMADSFSEAIRKVAESSFQVSAASSQLQITAEQIATAAEEVACQSTTVATASEEMSATSNDISHNCSLASEVANRASNTASGGSEVVRQTLEGMQNIAQKVSESAQTVESLGARSEQIGAIVGTIKDIADQTNLLALNAAIEAARAGEQGRGFAVVADEVRALAERTTRATKEISDMIRGIQQETGGAVESMENGVREVEKGMESSRKSGEALRQIMDGIGEVTMQVHQIATAAEEQTAVTGEISTNIHQITDVVQETANGAHETAAAAAQLSSLANELQVMVGRFKLA